MNYLKDPLALFLPLGHKTAAMADRCIRRANTPVVDATEAVSGTLAAMMNGPEPG